ncbi:VOC family protein [Actinomadura sp. ATCC 31491]|uniref:VOC family protein n=1 Tax=Actinomadura luzonensis TaxID=2805427 RepID=A0ABT0FP77_9ACTN|nr:VOC family protein [Actinomadura luzonensis]MCK2214086.1 VOC family protein [Actinomadura luzonensis]
MAQKITTFLWFDNQAEEAAAFYTSLFAGSRIVSVQRPPGAEVAMTVEFELAGQRYLALNGGPEHSFTEAVSLFVDCESQEEVDELWARLTADGGEEGPCGWLKDRWGLSWQIIPRGLPELLGDPDPERARRAMKAMRSMSRIDLRAMEEAADGR